MTTVYQSKPGTDKVVFIVCPGCKKILYVKRHFWTPRYSKVKVQCYHCGGEFAKEEARGPLRDIPSLIVLRSFLGLFFSYFITDLLIGSQLSVAMKTGAFDYFIDIYLHGILAGE